ncbi:MAG TPA: FAD binding domain-containing protein [Candidatus Obscuribacterales bacterium]
MRDYVLIYLNGRRHEIRGEQAFLSLSDYLRYERGLTGTKVVCAEGDCGACTILRGTLRPDGEELYYEAINSCITFMHLMDCTQIISVEGLSENGSLNPIQQAMIEHHGAQCGYCTPGFICAMTDFVNHRAYQSESAGAERYLDARQLRNCMTGNLCRCTGYAPILAAGTSIDLQAFTPLQERFETPELLNDLQTHRLEPVRIEAGNKLFYAPTSFADAAAFRASSPQSRIFSSATDLGVLINKDKTEQVVVTHLGLVPEAHELSESDGKVVVGAKVSLSHLEHFCRSRIPEFARLMRIFASPQIKNKGTLVGNIANASPIADTLPFLFVAEAEVELLSSAGTRRVNINEFYTGYKKLAMAPDELISRVFIPIPGKNELLRLYKVSNRKDLDISTFTAAIRLKMDGQTIEWARIAYGGVAPTILRLPQTEVFLQGQHLDAEVFTRAGHLARTEIAPISDVRASADYRLQLAENILLKFYCELEETVSEPALSS